MQARERARRALRAAGLDPDATLQRAVSNANEAWLGEGFALRINTRGDGTLTREATVARQLPAQVRFPGVLDHGVVDGFEWTLVRRAPGMVLSRAWPSMTRGARRRAMGQLAAALRALHASPVQAPTRDDFAPPHTLGLDALLALVERARSPFDGALMDELAEFIRARYDAFDGGAEGFVHGDPHLENVLWDGREISAVLDLEWSRRGPVELDLETLLSFFDHPWFFVAEDYEDQARAADYAEATGWLREDAPAWFGHPRLRDRLALLHISRTLSLFDGRPSSAPRDPGDPRDRRNHLRAALDGHAPRVS
ncbi:MAG: phosphotransferase [Myxococcales bacterium]|nr:phosphotransferase [Myxococcales bacterium]